MDPIQVAINRLRLGGVHVERTDDAFAELYNATGYPELTRNQVFSLANQTRFPTDPSER